MEGFLKLENRYFISAELVLEKSLHVGKGVSLEPVGTDLPVIKDARGLPLIPGSTVKGTLRSELERIARTLGADGFKIDGEKLRACEPLIEREKWDKWRCIDSEKKEEIERRYKEGKIDDKQFFAEIWENTCTICRLFGSPWLASRISFKDMFVKDEEEPLHPLEVRNGVAIDRDTGTARARAKFDYEVVVPGIRFSFEAILENVEPWEAGLFCLVLKLWERGEIALGGRTSAGMGWGRLKNIKIEKVKRNNLIDYLLEGKKEEENMERLIEELKSKLKKGGANAPNEE